MRAPLSGVWWTVCSGDSSGAANEASRPQCESRSNYCILHSMRWVRKDSRLDCLSSILDRARIWGTSTAFLSCNLADYILIPCIHHQQHFSSAATINQSFNVISCQTHPQPAQTSPKQNITARHALLTSTVRKQKECTWEMIGSEWHLADWKKQNSWQNQRLQSETPYSFLASYIYHSISEASAWNWWDGGIFIISAIVWCVWATLHESESMAGTSEVTESYPEICGVEFNSLVRVRWGSFTEQ